MKVPPKRKGNRRDPSCPGKLRSALNESPSEKEGKSCGFSGWLRIYYPQWKSLRKGREIVDGFYKPNCFSGPSMKVPPKRKGNSGIDFLVAGDIQPSMKVPPKRKGNSSSPAHHILAGSLNESPSEKEGKCHWNILLVLHAPPQWKSLRKGREITISALRFRPEK